MKKTLLIGICALAFVAQTAFAKQFQYIEGKHYVKLPIPIHTPDPNKIEVTEYFSYGCPHCYAFDPLINAWKATLPKDVMFDRTPAIWNKDYEVYAQTYYTAKALNILDKVHTPIFEAIHAEGKPLNTPEAMAKFFTQFGVDPIAFAKTYSSFGVRASVQQAEARGRAYRASGVPTLIINGKYRIEGSMAGSNANMLRVADFLIEKERRAMHARQQAETAQPENKGSDAAKDQQAAPATDAPATQPKSDPTPQ